MGNGAWAWGMGHGAWVIVDFPRLPTPDSRFSKWVMGNSSGLTQNYM
ncbi:MAG TPA: hypothetical protein V6D48_25055 [Oculatellaceae cyanobacterium]